MDVKCYICGGTTRSMPWGGRVCLACESISASNLPTPARLTEFYEDFNKRYRGGSKKKGQKDRYARAYLDIVKDLKDGGSLIDIGSSTNPFPNFADQAGYQVTIIDYAPPPDLSTKVEFVEGNLNNDRILDVLNKKFDIVCAFAVLEHCLAPRLAIRLMASLCAPGGYVVITTPEVGCFSDRNALGRSGWFCPPMHLHLISRKAMVLAFRSCGCNLVYSKKFELNRLRWLSRYGLGVAEGVIGGLAKQIIHRYWVRAREKNKSKYKGIAVFVFQEGGRSNGHVFRLHRQARAKNCCAM